MSKTSSSKEFIKRKKVQFEKERGKEVVKMKDIGRKGFHFFERVAWTFLVQSNLPEKVFVVERMKKIRTEGTLSYPHSWKKGLEEYRFGYFILGQINARKGKWTWGQYCPMIPAKDFSKLVKVAIKEGTIKL